MSVKASEVADKIPATEDNATTSTEDTKTLSEDTTKTLSEDTATSSKNTVAKEEIPEPPSQNVEKADEDDYEGGLC